MLANDIRERYRTNIERSAQYARDRAMVSRLNRNGLTVEGMQAMKDTYNRPYSRSVYMGLNIG